ELDEMSEVGFSCDDPPAGDLYLECLFDPGDAIREGRIIVDPVGMDLFEDSLLDSAAACPNFGVYPFVKMYYYRLVRAPALLGQVDEGEGCSIEEECLEGLYCDFFYGTCRETLRIGTVCRDDRECELGLVCARGRCAHPGEEGDRCERYDECDIGLWCDAGHCAHVLEEGWACDPVDMSCEGNCSFYGPGRCRDFCDGR
ncbi:MAG: Dickkopf N-terminal cysteine-rich domain-containing protein, partial [Pseudomonadota bacterium]